MKIVVKAKPDSRENKVEKVDDTHFIVWVKDPPVKNRANLAIVREIAAHFDVPRSQVRFVSGHMSPSKILDVIS